MSYLKKLAIIRRNTYSTSNEQYGIVKLPAGKSFVKDIQANHSDHAVIACYQPAVADYGTKAKINIFAQIYAHHFYDDLRTQQQLGYVVFMLANPLNAIKSLLCFLVESAKYDSGQLFKSIENFLEKMRPIMTSADAKIANEAVAKNTRDIKPTNRNELKARIWTEIVSDDYEFDRNERFVAATSEITLGELATFANDLLDPSRNRLLVLKTASVIDPANAGIFNNFTKLLDFQSLKANAEYYP